MTVEANVLFTFAAVMCICMCVEVVHLLSAERRLTPHPFDSAWLEGIDFSSTSKSLFKIKKNIYITIIAAAHATSS